MAGKKKPHIIFDFILKKLVYQRILSLNKNLGHFHILPFSLTKYVGSFLKLIFYRKGMKKKGGRSSDHPMPVPSAGYKNGCYFLKVSEKSMAWSGEDNLPVDTGYKG